VRQLAGWIDGAWIHSNDEAQNCKFWIQDNWIWGPVGAQDVTTRYWIKDGWIWNAAGGEASTGYYIQDGFIFGPDPKLPFVR
jgi:hypothetical protein